MNALVYMLWTYILLDETLSQTIDTVTYTGTLTTINCPGEGDYTLPSWTGPPYTTPAGTAYTLEGSPQFNPSLASDILARLGYADNQRSLLLNNTRKGDAARYSCSILGMFASASNNVLVRVLSEEPAITASVIVDSNGVLATEGQTVTVTCMSRGGNPAPTVVWYKRSITGQELARNSTGTQVGDTYTVTLSYSFTPSRQDDREKLVCRSYYPTPANAQGSQIKIATLYLFLKPSPPAVEQLANSTVSNKVSIECRTAGGRPAANVSWTYQGRMYSPNVTVTEDPSTRTFTAVSVLQMNVTAADNDQTAQCAVTHRALASALTGSTTLTVRYPPEVTVYVTNATVENISTTITCSPSGNPDIYTYSEWIHTWEGHVVSRHPNTPVLTLTRLSYEHSGIYLCRVTNGIGGYQQGFGMLLVESFPIVIHPNRDFEVVTMIGETIHINVTFFSNSGTASVKCFRKLNTSNQEVGSLKLTTTEVNLPIFNYTVRTDGKIVDIVLTVTTKDDTGEYFIRLSNNLGNVEIFFNVTEGDAMECKCTDVKPSSATIIGTAVSGIVGGLILCVLLQYTVIRLSGRRIMKYKDSGKPTRETKETYHIELEVQSSDLNIDGPAMSYEMLNTDQSARPYSELTQIPQGPTNTYEMLGDAGQSTHMYSDLKSTQEVSTSVPADGKVYMNLSLK